MHAIVSVLEQVTIWAGEAKKNENCTILHLLNQIAREPKQYYILIPIKIMCLLYETCSLNKFVNVC